MLARGQLWLPVRHNAIISMLHVDDLVEAILAWLMMDAAPQQRIYEIADHDGGYRWDEVVALAQEALNKPIRLRRIPAQLALASVAIMQFLARLLHKPCFVTTEKLHEMLHPDWSVNSNAFMAATGWTPRISLSTGLARTMQWYQNDAQFSAKM
jgi:nucleoside-diphosphate-sugar epimerase